MRGKLGLTIIEVMIAVAICATLSAIAFSVLPQATESARQTVCKSNLKQIYQSLVMYQGDVDGPTIPGLPGIPRFVSAPGRALLPYSKSREVFLCPDCTPSMKKKLGSSYTFLIWLPTKYNASHPLVAQMSANVKQFGTSTTIVFCNIHDELIYQPRETKVSPVYQKPFCIDLLADGSVKAGRMNRPRTKLYSGQHY